MSFDVASFRKGFPQLERQDGDRRIVYFDNGASTLKHTAVTDLINSYNRFDASNVHRGAHLVSREGTESYERARKQLQKFVNASSPNEIVFTRGTTESLNLLAHSLGEGLQTGDEIVISSLEHHSNIVPWQELCRRVGCVLKVVPFDQEKGFDFQAFLATLSDKTKVVSALMYSNSFGQRLPVEEIARECRDRGIYSIIDAAQSVLTEPIDVQRLNCDFLCFSGHKMFGPYGIGLLYGREAILEELPPYQTGGSMIDRVSFEKTTYAGLPQKFEAGTPNIGGALGFGESAKVVQQMGIESGHAYVTHLRQHLKSVVSSFKKVRVYDFASSAHTGALSINVDGAHCSDVGTLLDRYSVAVRAGHHCTQPLMDLLGVPGTVRISMAPYNSIAEIDYFAETLHKIQEFF